jgi:two-component system OmpR family response regulator
MSRAHAAPEAIPAPALELAIENGAVTLGGKPLALTPAEQTILEYLYARRGEAVPRAELAPLLEGGGNSVDVYICKLRAKIEKPLGRRMIVTVRGVGYRLEI